MIKTPLADAVEKLDEALQETTLPQWFEWFCQEIRGAGNTIAAIRACKAEGATLLCADVLTAEDIAKEHNIKTGALRIVADPKEKKTIIDPAAVYELVKEAQRVRVLAEELVAIAKRKGLDR